MRSRILAGLGIAALCAGASFGQNARVDAMGECNVITDMTNILYFPAYMNDYRDVIQGTINPNVGPLIGVKSLGEKLNAGLLYDQQRVLDDQVYAYFVDGIISTLTDNAELDNELLDISPIPHFLLGGDLGAVALAVDLFYERALYSYHVLNEVGGVSSEKTVKAQFHNLGLAFGLNVDPDIVGLTFTFGGSLPFIAGEYDTTTIAPGIATTDREEAQTEIAGSGLLAVEAFFDAGDNTVTLGASGQGTIFQGKFTTEPNGVTPTTSMYPRDLLLDLGGYLALQHEFTQNNILVVAQATGGITMDMTQPDDIDATNYNPGLETENTINYSFNAGFEKVWKELGFLDLLQARCGLGYAGSVVAAREHGEIAGDTHDLRQRSLTDRTGFGATFGAGVGKGIFQFDVMVNSGAMVNLFKLGAGQYGGNDFAEATLTLDFGKLKK